MLSSSFIFRAFHVVFESDQGEGGYIIQFNLELYACIFDKYCVKTYFVSKDILQGWSDS